MLSCVVFSVVTVRVEQTLVTWNSIVVWLSYQLWVLVLSTNSVAVCDVLVYVGVGVTCEEVLENVVGSSVLVLVGKMVLLVVADCSIVARI